MKRRVFASASVVIGICALALGAAACGGASATPANESSFLVGKKPGDVYTAYTAAIGNATTIQELSPYLSRERKSNERDLEALKAKVPAGVLKLTAENIQGDKATLTVEATMTGAGGKEEPSVGTVVLVREDGAWKVDQETWKAK